MIAVFALGCEAAVESGLDEAEANAKDPVLNLIEWQNRRPTLIAKRSERDGKVVYRFDIRLQGENETVFFDI